VFEALREKYLNGGYMILNYHVFMEDILSNAAGDRQQMLHDQRTKLYMSPEYKSCKNDMDKFVAPEEGIINWASCLTQGQIRYLVKGNFIPLKI
jgi:hypothetical protein